MGGKVTVDAKETDLTRALLGQGWSGLLEPGWNDGIGAAATNHVASQYVVLFSCRQMWQRGCVVRLNLSFFVMFHVHLSD